MKEIRQYGILTDKKASELFSAINYKRQYCSECRSKREDFKEKDMKQGEDGKKHFGIILPGFSSQEVSPLDIMIIADSIGGGRKGDFRKEANVSLKEAVHYLGNYYMYEKIVTFHQYEMRKLLNWLENDLKKNWIFTDLVKCFVYQGRDKVKGKDGKDNMKEAIRYCSRYLDEQMDELDPKILLILGSRVASNYCNIRGEQLKSLIHGSKYSYSRKGKEGKDRTRYFIYSIFPSGRTADIWVKDIESRSDDAWQPVKNALIKCLL